MLYIKSKNSTDPHFNLAMEEYVLKYLNLAEEYLLLWQNEPAIIIGRHQNTLEEVNMDYTRAICDVPFFIVCIKLPRALEPQIYDF